jgi:lambda repressor-like predicted transcriptional regulator
MDQHYGHVVEKVIRMNGYSISELARLTKVNRRSIYNWFDQKYLRADIIYRIGCALNYDFSAEFPNLILINEFKRLSDMRMKNENVEMLLHKQANESYWKDKYINLLEKYNDLLKSRIEFQHRLS